MCIDYPLPGIRRFGRLYDYLYKHGSFFSAGGFVLILVESAKKYLRFGDRVPAGKDDENLRL